MPSDAELDAKLTELLRVMVSRLPSNKTLPTAIVQQLLRSKYGDTYSEAYVASRSMFIGDVITKLTIEKERAVTPVTANGGASEGDDDDDDGSSTTDEDDSDAGNSEEDEEDDGASDSDEDFDSDEEDEDEDEEDIEEPEKKRAREEVDAIASKEQQSSAASSSMPSVAERCKAMAECLRKLSYRVRAPTTEESLEEYLQEFLIAEFVKHGMDPAKYSKSDMKRYRVKREVELLQQDGASLTLDRRHRVGRGFNNAVVGKEAGGSGSQVAPSPSAGSARQASMFLDDE